MNPVTELKPYDFQEDGIDWLSDPAYRGRILADDMGLGKTLQFILTCTRSNFKRCLLVTLNSTRRVWRDEIRKWAPDAKFVVIDAYEMTPQQRVSAIKDKTNQFVIVNFQMMLKLADTLSSVYWDIVGFDEAQNLRNRHSKTHAASRLLCRKSSTRFVRLLTGTPVQNHQEDYWPMLRVCGNEFGSYWDFANKYCQVDVIYPPKYQAIAQSYLDRGESVPAHITRHAYGQSVSSVQDPDDPRVKALVEKIRPYVLRRTKEQVYRDLPEKIVQYIPLQLDSTARTMYDSMTKRMVCTLPTGEVVRVDTELSQTLRLLQIATSPQLLYGESSRKLRFEGVKANYLADFVDEIGDRPFVIFSQWSRVIDMIGNLFRSSNLYPPFSTFTGENVETRDRELDQWLAGQTQALLVTIDAGGVGLDFTRASVGLFVDRSWNPKKNEQAEDRLHRHGQKLPVHIRHLYVEETVEDENQLVSLDLKTQVAENVVESLVGE